ncbi:cell division protein SepF [Nonomuraea sp. NPDC048916]|uniref:cell division protein SepF n=1 Tax=Nonomuraea sp. NPDC048916 TaxID=3154232 RepID=UPI0033D38019
MAGAMRKMAVYLGLVEDDRYERYESYPDEYAYEDEPSRAGDDRPVPVQDREDDTDPGASAPRPTTTVLERRTTDLARITTLHPRTYNEARTIGEHFRDGTPVIMNLTEMVDSDAKRLVDFAAGLVFGLHGSIERVTNKVFLLSPANVEVTAEDKARIAERGFFNQS